MQPNDRDSPRFRSIEALGKQLVGQAENIPLGSLAHAIARLFGCVVRLLQRRGVRGGEPKTSRVYVRDGKEREIIVLFPGSASNDPGAIDIATRYQVAHELAHIALGHPLRDILEDDSDARNDDHSPHEIEAHFLACFLIRFHGGPISRRSAEYYEIDEVLTRYNVAEEQRKFLLRLIEASCARGPVQDTAQELKKFVEQKIGQFEESGRFQRDIESEVKRAMSRVLQKV